MKKSHALGPTLSSAESLSGIVYMAISLFLLPNALFWCNAQLLRCDLAHSPGFLHAVSVASVGVAAVADNCLSLAVLEVELSLSYRSTLNKVCCVDACSCTWNITYDEGKVRLCSAGLDSC